MSLADDATLEAMTIAVHDARSAQTVEEVAAMLPRAISAAGFERVLFSWVEENRWVPRAAYVRGLPDAEAALVAAGTVRGYASVLELVERQVVREAQTILVDRPTENPHVHPGLIAVEPTTGYVAGPIRVADRVIAMVHADHSGVGGVDEHDRIMLRAMLEALGAVFERLVLHEEIADAAAEFEQHVSALRRLLASEGTGTGTRARRRSADEGTSWEALTRRELQVMRLVTEGMTNSQIASRLFVAEATVKSHVKNAMRKLNVATRTEAGVAFMRHRLGR